MIDHPDTDIVPQPASALAISRSGLVERGLALANALPTQVVTKPHIEFDWVTIPAGEFLMGTNKETFPYYVRGDELPQHNIYLNEYGIARVGGTDEVSIVAVKLYHTHNLQPIGILPVGFFVGSRIKTAKPGGKKSGDVAQTVRARDL